MKIVEMVKESLKKYTELTGDWVIAYSGGVDSRVMLDILAGLKPSEKKLILIHVNHGLNPLASQWEAQAREVAKQYNAEIKVAHLNMNDTSGVEEKARDLRYAFINENTHADDIIFMGHHKNDNAETLLFRLFRGTGLKGLMGIPESRLMGKATLVRPMLQVLRSQIKDYADKKGLSWVEDDSNADSKYSRNFIRNDVIPLLETRWKSVVSTITSLTEKAAEAETLLSEIAEGDMAMIKFEDKSGVVYNDVIDMEKLKMLSEARMKNVLHRFVSTIDDENKGTKSFNNLLNVVLSENKNCSRLRKVEFKNGLLITNGKKLWIENNKA